MLDWEMEALAVLPVSNLTSGLKEKTLSSVNIFFYFTKESLKILEQSVLQNVKAIELFKGTVNLFLKRCTHPWSLSVFVC